eukprot:TRINITY_DN1229_c0_g1_i2.p1 TRINITY_DN1229_c0_g1~~TRINITY_DN1229_c0_g1_i2.p1  ORF type:complete len:282 (-),score=94.33 TRINITY_DN1229_c0_g1_i2:975-1820(-)
MAEHASDEPTQAVDLFMAEIPIANADLPKSKRPWGKLISLNPAYADCPLTGNEVVLGRQSICDIRIDNQIISGRHCKIVREGGYIKNDDVIFIEDLSTNGTHINGEKLGKGNRLILPNGAEICLYPKRAKKIAYLFQMTQDEDESAQDPDGPHKKYFIRETLGTGAFAAVKLAIKKDTGERFAIKIIDKKKFAMNSSSRKNALMDEVTILMRVNHRNIIGITEMFDTEKSLYLVLELVTGGELFDTIIEVGSFKEVDARPLFAQMIEAVDYLHDMEIAHRV